VYWSTDGLDFRPGGPFPNNSTGVYGPANFEPGPNPNGITRGTDTTDAPRKLFCFRCDLRP